MRWRFRSLSCTRRRCISPRTSKRGRFGAQPGGLEPELAVTGHGHAMRGPAMRAAQLASAFQCVAVLAKSAYVNWPGRVEDGTAYPGRS
jgi:hypothetical protein